MIAEARGIALLSAFAIGVRWVEDLSGEAI